RLARAAVDRRRRRPGLGARANRPLRRGAALLKARPQARHARCAQDVPPRDDRGLPGASGIAASLACPGSSPEPAVLDSLGTGRQAGAPMKRLAVLLVVAAALLAPAAASAHPLGNFTINRFARVEVAGHRLYVRYVLDLAEIPTYQARQDGVDPAVYTRRVARGLHITVDGRSVPLRPVAHALAFPRG